MVVRTLVSMDFVKHFLHSVSPEYCLWKKAGWVLQAVQVGVVIGFSLADLLRVN